MNIGDKELEAMLKEDTWFDSETALKYGFADEVIAKMQAVALSNNNIPDHVKEKVFISGANPDDKTTKPKGGSSMNELLKALGVQTEEEALVIIASMRETIVSLNSEKATLENRVIALDKQLEKVVNDNVEHQVAVAVASGEILPKDVAVAKQLLKADPDKYAKWKSEQKKLVGMVTGRMDYNVQRKSGEEFDIEVR